MSKEDNFEEVGKRLAQLPTYDRNEIMFNHPEEMELLKWEPTKENDDVFT